MRWLACWLLFAGILLAQSDRGSFAGTVSDPVKGPVPRARITLKDTATGAQFQTVCSQAGSYQLSSMPPGTYQMTITAPGYNRFIEEALPITAGETIRFDALLQTGLMSEALATGLDLPLLDTESAELAMVLTADQVDALPLVRPNVRPLLDFAILVPGVSGVVGDVRSSTLRVNASPADTFRVLVDGQDITSSADPARTLEQQPSLEALTELRLQTSNQPAEFGQAAGGLFNLKTQSGSAQSHGGASLYFRNEFLNAGQPFSDNGAGRHVKPRSRDYNFSANIGGPVYLPGIYNGGDGTYFYLSVEQYRVRSLASGTYTTVPTAAYRAGDFSAALTGRSLGKDALGRDIGENMIYDPGSTRTEAGQLVRDPFPGNRIDASRIDPVAARLQKLIPMPDPDRLQPDGSPMLVNNFAVHYPTKEDRLIPSARIDHNLGAEGRVFFYAGQYRYAGLARQDGLPAPVTGTLDRRLVSWTFRLAGDYAVTPSLLAHLVLGWVRWAGRDLAERGVREFPAADPVRGIGLAGGAIPGMPHISVGMGTGNRGGLGMPLGAGDGRYQFNDKPSAAASLIYQRGNHTYKAGGEAHKDYWAVRDLQAPIGSWTFSPAETGLPYLQTASLAGGGVGFPYASLLLGKAASASVSNVVDPRYAKTAIGLYWQDIWRATSRLTLDYGIRWDSQSAPQETHYRNSIFGPTVPNPSAGGLSGGMVYAGFGAGRCNCTFTSTYPYAFGPRFGAALQATPKTVVRGGGGVSYGNPNNYNDLGGGLGVGWNTIDFASTSFGEAAATLQTGLVYNPADLSKVVLDPGLRPSPGQIDSPPLYFDRNGGRPSRIVQWSFSIQREFARDFLLEAAYVGNRSVWNQANSLMDWNALSTGRLAAFGLDITKPADRQLLISPVGSPLAQSKGFGKPPYPGFPTTLTVAQSLRPFPQFGDIPVLWAPLGNTWYDAFQGKFTKRLRGGLSGTAAFTWQKELTLGVYDQSGSFPAVNDVFNRSKQKTLFPQSRPLVTVVTFSYQIPRAGPVRLLRALLGDWTISGYLRYRSGALIPAPLAQNNLSQLLFRGTYANRVPGQKPYLTRIDGKIDPNQQFVLNPAAWSDPAPGEWGQSSVYFNDYRARRTPEEYASAGRVIRIGKNVSLELRFEFYNVFNRLMLPVPDSTNALAPQTRDSAGKPVSGFGYIATDGGVRGSRNGQLLARLRW